MNLSAFVCEYEGCNLIYENPVALSCGNLLCQHHLEKFDDKFNNRQFCLLLKRKVLENLTIFDSKTGFLRVKIK